MVLDSTSWVWINGAWPRAPSDVMMLFKLDFDQYVYAHLCWHTSLACHMYQPTKNMFIINYIGNIFMHKVKTKTWQLRKQKSIFALGRGLASGWCWCPIHHAPVKFIGSLYCTECGWWLCATTTVDGAPKLCVASVSGWGLGGWLDGWLDGWNGKSARKNVGTYEF